MRKDRTTAGLSWGTNMHAAIMYSMSNQQRGPSSSTILEKTKKGAVFDVLVVASLYHSVHYMPKSELYRQEVHITSSRVPDATPELEA